MRSFQRNTPKIGQGNYETKECIELQGEKNMQKMTGLEWNP